MPSKPWSLRSASDSRDLASNFELEAVVDDCRRLHLQQTLHCAAVEEAFGLAGDISKHSNATSFA